MRSLNILSRFLEFTTFIILSILVQIIWHQVFFPKIKALFLLQKAKNEKFQLRNNGFGFRKTSHSKRRLWSSFKRLMSQCTNRDFKLKCNMKASISFKSWTLLPMVIVQHGVTPEDPSCDVKNDPSLRFLICCLF